MDNASIHKLVKGKISLDFDEYPKEEILKDGSWAKMRPIIRDDEEGFTDFFTSLPEEERLYLRDDIINPELTNFWVESTNYDTLLPILAIVDGRIVGNCTLYRSNFSWRSHIGHMRITVLPEYRQNGLARILAGEVFSKALSTDLKRVMTELVPAQEDVRKAFTQLGFREEAILKDHHLDPRGGKHDILIMSNDFELLWKGWLEYCEMFSGTWNMED